MRKMTRNKYYSADGYNYKSKNMLDVHNALKNNPHVQSFNLPHIGDGQKRSKWGAYKATVNGIKFDSVMEARYYVHLLDEKQKENIVDFKMQVKYNLLPKGRNKFKNKAILATNYIADFEVLKNDGNKVVIDVKGKKTPDFRIKEKIFLLKYPDIEFKCVQWDNGEKAWRDLDDIAKDKRARKRKRKTKK